MLCLPPPCAFEGSDLGLVAYLLCIFSIRKAECRSITRGRAHNFAAVAVDLVQTSQQIPEGDGRAQGWRSSAGGCSAVPRLCKKSWRPASRAFGRFFEIVGRFFDYCRGPGRCSLRSTRPTLDTWNPLHLGSRRFRTRLCHESRCPPKALPKHGWLLRPQTLELQGACIRDMSSATDYHTGLLPSFAPIGRRIEIIMHTVHLSTAAFVSKSQPKFGRLMFSFSSRRMPDVWKAADWHQDGESLFLFDGHSTSTRCPSCANLWHFVADDLLMTMLALIEERAHPKSKDEAGSKQVRTVANLLATEGRREVKRFQLDLLHALSPLFGDINFVAPDEVHCFQSVKLAINEKTARAETLRVSGFYKAWGVSQASLLAFRAALVQARTSKPRLATGAEQIFVDGRQSAKRQKWSNAVEVANMLGAAMVDLGSMTLQQTAQTLQHASVFVTSTGAQNMQLMWMPVESLVVLILCPAFPNEFMIKSFFNSVGLQMVEVLHEECPDSRDILGWADTSAPSHAHPVAVLGEHYGGVVTGSCVFRLRPRAWKGFVLLCPCWKQVLVQASRRLCDGARTGNPAAKQWGQSKGIPPSFNSTLNCAQLKEQRYGRRWRAVPVSIRAAPCTTAERFSQARSTYRNMRSLKKRWPSSMIPSTTS